MLKQSAKLTLLYLAGIPIVCGWSLTHVFGGTVTTENAAAVIVFPLAWIFGYWGVAGPLLVAYKVWKLQSSLEAYCEQRAMGLTGETSKQEIEDTLTMLVVAENPVSERFARKLIKRFLKTAHPGSAEVPGATADVR